MAAFAFVAVLGSACGSSGGPLAIGPAQDGQTVTVARGDRITLTLPGTSWQFDLAPAFGPLSELSTETHSGRTSTETVVFRATVRGKATVHAHWAPCATQTCRPGQGQYVVHVEVS